MLHGKKRVWAGLAFVLIAGILAIYVLGNVATGPTAEDRLYAAKLMGPITPPRDYRDEIATIRNVQRKVLELAAHEGEIPAGQTRELKDIYESRQGWCFDRSRAIEKLLAIHGLPVRHVSLYQKQGDGSLVRTLATRKLKSHALSEVLTSRGWLLVDSNVPWIALGAGDRPISALEIAEGQARDLQSPGGRNPTFNKPFYVIYGFYSRNGRFFPPFTPVPDVNFEDLVRHGIHGSTAGFSNGLVRGGDGREYPFYAKHAPVK